MEEKRGEKLRLRVIKMEEEENAILERRKMKRRRIVPLQYPESIRDLMEGEGKEKVRGGQKGWDPLHEEDITQRGP